MMRLLKPYDWVVRIVVHRTCGFDEIFVAMIHKYLRCVSSVEWKTLAETDGIKDINHCFIHEECFKQQGSYGCPFSQH